MKKSANATRSNSCRSSDRRHDAVLTLEAARENGDIVTARKAGCWVTVEVTGKAAHAGVEPEKGRSATAALGHILVETFKLNGMNPGMTVNPGDHQRRTGSEHRGRLRSRSFRSAGLVERGPR